MKRWVTALLGVGAIATGGLALGTANARAGGDSGKARSNDRIVREIEHKVVELPGMREESYLGVRLENPEGEEARGAVVRGVEDDSPAVKAGIEKGDTIVRFDGETVRSASQLARLVRETPPGRSVKVEVLRDGASRTLTARTGEARNRWVAKNDDEGFFVPDTDFDITVPEPFPPHQPGGTPFVGPGPHVFRWKGPGDNTFALPWLAEPMRLGVQFMELGDQLATYFGVAKGRGVLVTSVEADSPAAKAGVQAGDVILEFDGHAIEDGADLRLQVRDAEGGDALAVKVQRHGKPLDLEVTLAERESPHHREAELSL